MKGRPKGAPPRERGRPARILIPGWRSRSVSGTLQAGSGPFGVNRTGKTHCLPVGLRRGRSGLQQSQLEGGRVRIEGGHLEASNEHLPGTGRIDQSIHP